MRVSVNTFFAIDDPHNINFQLFHFKGENASSYIGWNTALKIKGCRKEEQSLLHETCYIPQATCCKVL